MYLRISALLWCAVLIGFATAAQSNSDKSFYPSEIDIDDLEGSGGGTEVSRDLESSGSGFGPDDEDSPDTHRNVENVGVKVVPPTVPPRVVDTDVLHSSNEDISKSGPTFNSDSGVVMNPKSEDAPTSFFAQPGILAAVIGGAVVGLLCAILVVMFIVYRMRKKDEGSYPLDEPKHSPVANSYSRNHSKEFFA